MNKVTNCALLATVHQTPKVLPTYVVPSTSIAKVIDVMNERDGEGMWIVDKDTKAPMELLHCTDLIRFLLLKEKKLKDEQKVGASKNLPSLGGTSALMASEDDNNKRKEHGGGKANKKSSSYIHEQCLEFSEEETSVASYVNMSRSGWLYKRSPAFHKKWQHRWFVLSNTSMQYFKDPKVMS